MRYCNLPILMTTVDKSTLIKYLSILSKQSLVDSPPTATVKQCRSITDSCHDNQLARRGAGVDRLPLISRRVVLEMFSMQEHCVSDISSQPLRELEEALSSRMTTGHRRCSGDNSRFVREERSSVSVSSFTERGTSLTAAVCNSCTCEHV